MRQNRSSPAVVPIELWPLGFLHAYLLIGDRVIVVDAGTPSSSGRILDALKRQHVARSDVSLILITHGHRDHLGGARDLREQLGAPIALHREDAEVARTGKFPPSKATSRLSRLASHFLPQKQVEPFEPDVVFGELDLARYGVSGRTLHTPGHTPGSVSVLLERSTIAGDLMMGGLLRRGTPRYPAVADDIDELSRSIAQVLLQGHGPLFVGHRGPLQPEAVAKRFRSQPPGQA